MRQLDAWLATTGVVSIVVLLWGGVWTFGETSVDQRFILVPIFAGLLWWMRSTTGRSASAERWHAASRWIDPLMAAVLIQAILFRAPRTVLAPALIFLALFGALWLFKWLGGPARVAVASVFVLVALVLPRAFEAAILARVSSTYALDVDHRLWPDGKEINSDSARFKGEAVDLSDDDFVVLFLGDSFTFGFSLAYEDSYPYRVEALARADTCDARVRVVNMGWTSSSPLLALRLLRQVGHKYRPDLVVYSLDATDFHDDLRYERMLREEDDYAFDGAAIAERLIARELPWATPLAPVVAAVTTRLRSVDREARASLLEGLAVPGPSERFFATARPLDETRPAIELGVMRNLQAIDEHARAVLGAETALVLYPRAYQYSDREVPRNWERGYEPLGPFVQEPFRYFAEVADGLPYPVIDVLADFEESEAFPLYFGNDPHWTEKGADVAARGVYRDLVETGLVPCRSQSPAR